MSSSRLIYDDCAYEQRLKESTNPLRYVLNPQKYENCNKCRYELGLLGGPNVSINSGNLVDVESDLSGRTRALTECSARKYKPKCAVPNGKCKNDTGIPYDCDECQPMKRHLRTCKFTEYNRPTDNGLSFPEIKCPPSGSRRQPRLYNRTLDREQYRAHSWQGQQGSLLYK